MPFVVFRCSKDPETFIVTDPEHEAGLKADECCPTPGGQLERIGEFPEIGEERVAFNEAIAKSAIRHHGYYRFASKTFSTAEWPTAAPL